MSNDANASAPSSGPGPVSRPGARSTVVVPARFNGPPESGNGGWVSGLLAGWLTDAPAASVRLRTPPPLERELTLSIDGDGGLAAHDRDVLVATAMPAAPSALTETAVEPVPFAVAQACAAAYEGRHDHPFASCFSCGTAREDGLGLRPGRVPDGDGAYAASWVAREVSPEIVWAALDCPGGWSAGIAGRPMVLGTMTAALVTLPAVGEECVVMAWPRGGEGRKYLSGTALYGADGRLLGRAEATWIAVDPASVRPH